MSRRKKPTLERDKPTRILAKKDAIRHLIHAAIRMTFRQEDPFAVHLLAHSADQTLTDYAKQMGQQLAVDWTAHVLPERRSEFVAFMREGANFLKHGKTDAGDELFADNIVQRNILALFPVAVNYATVFGELTDHMKLLMGLVQIYFPQGIILPLQDAAAFHQTVGQFEKSTPAELIKIMMQNVQILAPNFQFEQARDLEDNRLFFDRTLESLHEEQRARKA